MDKSSVVAPVNQGFSGSGCDWCPGSEACCEIWCNNIAMQIQEDVRKGVSVANLKKVVVNSVEDVISLLSKVTALTCSQSSRGRVA